ncbi:MAG: hypothetical protein WBZ16_15550 [Pseudolabrys sp.]
MAQAFTIRRASIYHQRARQLAEAATREPREIERRHLLGLAAMYQRIADNLASEKPDEIQSAEAVRLKA